MRRWCLVCDAWHATHSRCFERDLYLEPRANGEPEPDAGRTSDDVATFYISTLINPPEHHSGINMFGAIVAGRLV